MSESQIDKIAQIAEKISAEENRSTRQTHTINSLLNERQKVLVTMCTLAELETDEIASDTVIHDLRNDACPANPAVALDHPLVLFMDEAVHGGLWRTDVQLRSVLEIAAVRGFLSGGHRRR